MSRHFGGKGPARTVDRAKNVVMFSLVLLVVLSSLGVLLLYSSSNTKATTQTVVVEKRTEVEMAEVVVPTQPIQAGTPLEPVMFRLESRPRKDLSSRIVRNIDEIQGYYARSLIVPDQPLHGDYITKVKPNSEISANIPEGYRAVTIRVDARSSVEGWARPGSKVDVVWASTIRGQQAVTVIVQNARVLSAERNTNTEVKGKDPAAALPSTVTLLVTADDAAKIQLASTSGSMSLQLRGDSDKGGGSKAQTITLENLLQGNNSQEKAPDKHEGVIRVQKPNGQMEEFVLRDGRMVPAPVSK